MFAFHQTLFVLTWFILLIFILLPTEIHIRNHIPSDIREGEGFWGFWYGDFMHVTDNPWNAWPSLHVVQSLLIILVLRRWNVITGLIEKIVWICWIALCISIMTTKQHFLLDLVTGISVAIISWRWVFVKVLNSANKEKWLEKLPS